MEKQGMALENPAKQGLYRGTSNNLFLTTKITKKNENFIGNKSTEPEVIL